MSHTMQNQQGAVLIVSLILLILITVLAITGMSGGLMEMQMAGNEESRIEALQIGQAVVDEIAEDIDNFPVIGLPGDVVKCTDPKPAGITSCKNATAISLSDFVVNKDANGKPEYARVAVRRIAPALGIPNPARLRGEEFSVDSFKATFFQIEAEHDASANKLGRAKIVQGYMVMIPSAD